MSGATPEPIANSLIAGLPRGEQRRLLADCFPVELVSGALLCQPGKPLRDAYFPLSGCLSLAAVVGRHPPLDMVLVGSEGMLGLSLALGIGRDAPMLGMVRCPGSALRMPEAQLRRELARSPGRAHADHFHLTHELLADMLGVQRSAVSIAAGTLQKAQVISYSRGEIQILDRSGLEAMSCECYQASRSHAPRC